jgi:hypothetical protein
MITTAQKKKLKEVFKKGYAQEVLQKLNEKGLLSRKGASYSISFITHVFNGRYENISIEETIVELYEVKLAEAKEFIERKKRIFNA